ncbi:hypothetical protein A2W14_02665 [Candidatus Gottesmanbacteria bacterium RBG_16_37_8]|uniref:Antitoxin n=1 Tax=Candidatus Gottesmanbacteria bacterium RBG_16_37_8 TaxID=1798371 RepID=A0A1F5YRQ6_9BACT|nr:MAG: hypothetical protein A2W14_02665 [Candidatus Gottesmanbacteria bacterium RBG_16_37_8]
MNTTNEKQFKTVNTTDIRFRLGSIISELERTKSPVLIISRSRPKAWLYPFEKGRRREDPFALWYKKILPKYAKISANQLIDLVRKDRDNR